MSPELRRFGDETAPSDDAAARVRARALETADRAWHKETMAALRRPWFAAAGGLSLAAAGVVFGLLLKPTEAPRLQAELAGSDWETLVASEDVQLVFQGRGTLAGSEQGPEIEWESGTVKVAVEPGRGIDLRVRTPEALVQVIGTRFAVKRDARGSHVEVQKGLVSVSCTDGVDVQLPPGRVVTCKPVTAAGLLARAGALNDDRVDLDVVLETIDSGAAKAEPGSAVAVELEFLRIASLAGWGRFDEALAAAVALEGRAGHRAPELAPLAVRLAYRVGGCERAAEHARKLPPGEDPLEGRCP